MSIIQSLYGEEHEYNVNGATYIVSAAFKHTGRKEDNTSFPTCVKKIINSDFAHLIITEENEQSDINQNLMTTECRFFKNA